LLRFISRIFTSHKDINRIASCARVVVRFTAEAENITNGIPTGQNCVELFLAVPGCQAFLSSVAQARTFARVGPAIFMHKHKVRSRSEYSSAAARNAAGSMLASSSVIGV
jgi:hypothetical protein